MRTARQLLGGGVLIATLVLGATPGISQIHPPEGGGPLPEEALRVLREDPTAYQARRGWRQQAQRLKANRALLEQGVLKGSPEELHKMTVVSGVRNVPIFLAKYNDTGADPFPVGNLQQELFDGPWSTGTMTKYYDEVSYGNLQVEGTVFDWVTVSQDDDYYSGGVRGLDPAFAKVGEFIQEILAANDAGLDFGLFDNDGPDGLPNSGDDDGFVDFIGIVQPESGGECGPGPLNDLWSHQWVLSRWDAGIYTTDDAASGGGFIRVDDYTLMPSIACFSSTMIQIGVFCHEFGHAFGIPDLYDTDDTEDSEGIGFWGLMGAGNQNTASSPAHMTAWTKAELGWLTPAVVTGDLLNWPIAPSTTTQTAFKLWKNGTPGDEYFLVENRIAVGFDSSIQAPGLLIWHIDDRETNNRDETHKMIDLECADQTGPDHTVDADGLDRNSNKGDANDPFCDGDSFNPTSTPSSVAYNGVATGVRVENIIGCGVKDVVAADLIVGQPGGEANLCMRDCGGDACNEPSACDRWWASPELYIDNNNDGIIDPPAEGIANRLFARVRNVGGNDASSVDVAFYYADPGMGLSFPSTATHIDTENIPLIEAGGSEVGEVLWTIPLPLPEIDHYCVGVIATNSEDGQSSELAREDNNVAQINIQALIAKAGDAVPKTAEVIAPGELAWSAPAADPPWEAKSRVAVCNNLDDVGCEMLVLAGSPPNYDDVIVKGDWVFDIPNDQIFLASGKCTDILVTVRNNNPVHGDRLVLPLTLLCNQLPIGGTILEYEIDNVPPPPPCALTVSRRSPPQGDEHPGDGSVEISWKEDFADAQNFPERVERWRIYNGSFSGFPLTPSSLLIETCIDEKDGDDVRQHFSDIPINGNDWYAMVAIDRAGNESEACYSQVELDRAVGVRDLPPRSDLPLLEQNVPNPFNPTTVIRYQLPTDGEVRMKVYDLHGRLVRSLVSGWRESGEHRLIWDGKNDAGASVASGSYVYTIDFEDRRESRRMILLK